MRQWYCPGLWRERFNACVLLNAGINFDILTVYSNLKDDNVSWALTSPTDIFIF